MAAQVIAPEFTQGSVWLVGAGPGDPGLLTLHAAHALEQADVILHDALIAPEILALGGASARLEAVGKRAGRPSAKQLRINQRLIDLARAGLRVVRLKGGDPLVFGRGGEEAVAILSAATTPGAERRITTLAGAAAAAEGARGATLIVIGSVVALGEILGPWQQTRPASVAGTTADRRAAEL